MIWLAIIMGAIGAGLGAWTLARSKETLPFRILHGFCWLCAAALVCVVLARVCQLASSNWSGAKLAPVIAMTKGYRLYQDPDNGVMTGWIYGPMGALVMLPAALGKTPTTCGLIGAVIAMLCYFAPAAWLLLIFAKGRFNAPLAIALLVFGWWTMVSADLVDTSVIASPDAVVLGLSACACIALLLRRTFVSLLASALAAVLAAWTKQNYAGLIVGLFVWVLLEDGWNGALRFAGIIAAVGVVVSAIFIGCFGASNMWFHMVALPASHPFNHADRGPWMMWAANAGDFFLPLLPALGIFLLTIVLDRLMPPGASNIRSWLVARRWPMLAIVAVSLLPGGFMGMSKVGGGLNSLAGVHYFLLLAALGGIVTICENISIKPVVWRRGLETVLGILSFVLAAQGLLHPLNNEISIWSKFAHPYNNGAESAYRFVREHPHTIYSPWNPLVTLLAENRLYHFDVGIFDRYSAKRIPSTEQFTRHIPPDLRAIVYIEKAPGGLSEQIFTGFRNRVTTPELPNCILVTQ